MATNAVHGSGGSVKLATVATGDINNWKLDVGADLAEVTNFTSNGWKEYIAGLKEWSASFSGSFNLADANQLAFYNALIAGTAVTPKFFVDATRNYSGSAFIKKVSVDTAVNGEVKASFDVQGSGALTYA